MHFGLTVAGPGGIWKRLTSLWSSATTAYEPACSTIELYDTDVGLPMVQFMTSELIRGFYPAAEGWLMVTEAGSSHFVDFNPASLSPVAKAATAAAAR